MREKSETDSRYTPKSVRSDDDAKRERTFVASRMSVHLSPDVSTLPTYTGLFAVADFGVEGVSI
jgi:hypothetical protein